MQRRVFTPPDSVSYSATLSVTDRQRQKQPADFFSFRCRAGLNLDQRDDTNDERQCDNCFSKKWTHGSFQTCCGTVHPTAGSSFHHALAQRGVTPLGRFWDRSVGPAVAFGRGRSSLPAASSRTEQTGSKAILQISKDVVFSFVGYRGASHITDILRGSEWIPVPNVGAIVLSRTAF